MEQLLKYCRYYKGEKECPYESVRLTLIFNQEKKWVEGMMNKNYPMSDYLDTYYAYKMEDFEVFDDIPLSLKAYLYMFFLKGNELPLREDFEKFYKLWKEKKVE